MRTSLRLVRHSTRLAMRAHVGFLALARLSYSAVLLLRTANCNNNHEANFTNSLIDVLRHLSVSCDARHLRHSCILLAQSIVVLHCTRLARGCLRREQRLASIKQAKTTPAPVSPKRLPSKDGYSSRHYRSVCTCCRAST